MRSDGGTIFGMKVVLDDSMGREQVAVVNDDGHGYAVEDGEIMPCILPPPTPEKEQGDHE